MTVTELYEAFEERLHRFAVRLTRDPARADDLVQDTFVRTLSHIELLGQLTDPQRSAWLYRVMKNLFLDEQLAARRERALFERLALDASLASSPPDVIALPAIVEQVPDRYREILEKRYVLGMTSEEIACELGIPAATVRSRLHLAIKHLRARKARYL